MSLYYLNFLIPIVLVISLFLSWKNINARFLILSYMFVEVLSLTTYSLAKSMPIGFYLWSMFISLIFLIFVFGRRFWAFKLSRFGFFKLAYEQHKYSVQEAALVFIFSISVLINLITFFEVYFYSMYWIDNAYIKLYVRDYAHSIVNIVAAIVCLSYSFKSVQNSYRSFT